MFQIASHSLVYNSGLMQYFATRRRPSIYKLLGIKWTKEPVFTKNYNQQEHSEETGSFRIPIE
jgi:hypothetical protein